MPPSEALGFNRRRVVHGKLDMVIEYADREQATADSYPCFTECMNAVLDDINTNVRVLLPMTQTLRGMLDVKDTSITYDSKKATLCI